MSNGFDDKTPITIPYDELRTLARTLSTEMKAAGAELPPALRDRFIKIRSALFQRGVFDPVLVRFDTITAPRASVTEVADQLASVAASL
jgi:hypothetical protein